MAPSIIARRKPQVPAEETVAFGQIAERFRRAGDLERAVSLCRDGLQKFPDHISARATLGWSLLELGKFNEARIELESVLRRAPDNLSAIRGLAELHDRSEHTMDLPMDGPGQWPPTAETLEEMDRIASVKGDAPVAASDIVDEAVWAPIRGLDDRGEIDADVEPVSAGAFVAPPELGLAMWSAVSSEVSEEPAPPPIVAPASGMSSVRELDPNAGSVTFSTSGNVTTFDVAPAPAAAKVVDDSHVHSTHAAVDVDLAALIAEANSLEAAADVDARESAESTEPALVLDSAVDLSSFEEVGLVVPADELTAGYDAPVELTAGVHVEPEPAFVAASFGVETEPEIVVPPADTLTAYEAIPESEVAAAEVVAPVELVALVELVEIDTPVAFAPPVEMEAPVDIAVRIPIESPIEVVRQVDPELDTIVDAVASVGITAEVDEARSVESGPWFVLTPPDDMTASWSLDQLIAAQDSALAFDETPSTAAAVEGVLLLDFESIPEALPAPMPEPMPEPVVTKPVATRPVVTKTKTKTKTKIVEVVSLARADAPDPRLASVAALERFLVSVHARRRKLMAESVA